MAKLYVFVYVYVPLGVVSKRHSNKNINPKIMQNQGPSGGILRLTLPGVLRSIPTLAVELRSREKHLIVQLAGNFFRQVSSCIRCEQKIWLVLKTPSEDMSHRGK